MECEQVVIYAEMPKYAWENEKWSETISSKLKYPTSTMSVSKRVRIFALEDLDAHKSAQSCWVTYKGKVYDVTAFVADHPGGDDLILNNAGTNVENIMKDKDSHDHSESAYEMLEEYVIGRLGTDATIVSDGANLHLPVYTSVLLFHKDWEATDDFHPEDTDSAEDFAKTQFLNLREPLLWQMWNANFRSVP